jgi:hypothetical protein
LTEDWRFLKKTSPLGFSVKESATLTLLAAWDLDKIRSNCAFSLAYRAHPAPKHIAHLRQPSLKKYLQSLGVDTLKSINSCRLFKAYHNHGEKAGFEVSPGLCQINVY